MAIYHFSAQVISRSKGQSAVAAAAYRSGERFTDERTGETKFYQREVEPETMILAPSHSPEWVHDRQQLWNEVEKAETRKNSQVAREINIALPREISHQEQTELIRGYVQKEFVDQGMIADIAIHRDDQENPHAHVMLATREISEDGFTIKNRDWNKKELLLQWRKQWAVQANHSLEREGVEDRITHESHETRNLILFPTVHLGHVAHEMEKRGVETDRGSINRERQEYNRLVVNLQAYREEKQALEQELVRKQEQKQQAERFNTPTERVHLQEAAKLLTLDRHPTLNELGAKQKELTTWEHQLKNEDPKVRWKEETIRGASHTYEWIHTFEKQHRQAQQQLASLNWLNPFKLKENLQSKERAEQELSRVEDQLTVRNQQLKTYQEKLGFHTEKEFHDIRSQHQAYYPGFLAQQREARGRIHGEREVLNRAITARQNAFVRKIASTYPERPEMRYISLETAKNLAEINQANGNKVVPIEAIEQTLKNRQTEIQRLQGEMERVKLHQSRLQRAKGYLEHYQTHHTNVEKMENNPFLKGKICISPSSRQEYEEARNMRDHYQGLLKKEGVPEPAAFNKQVENVGRMEAQLPQVERQIKAQESGIGLLEGIIIGIEQASRQMQMEQQREELQRQKPKSRRKQQQGELER